MKIAILPRYVDLKIENSAWNHKHCVNHDFELMAHEFGVGLYTIMSPYDCEAFCLMCDGLIIPGSNNRVNPAYYGGEPMDPPPVHDDFALDSKIINCFAKNNKPIFGICAGLQALNICFGGTIGRITEDGSKPHYDTVHPVNIKPSSFVHDVYGSERAEINSYHVMHINKLASCFDVVAKSDDGIIEAIENKERRIFATQWHPEKSFREKYSIEQELFKNFLDICRK